MLRLQVHHPSDEIIVDGKRIVPCPSEMALISELFLNRKHPVSYKRLEKCIRRIDHVKPLYHGYGKKSAQLSVHVCMLRKKLGSAADILAVCESGMIHGSGGRNMGNVIGYMLVVKTTLPLRQKFKLVA